MLLHQNHYKHFLSVSVSYKSDPGNLMEFLEYHILVGVDHFYICNNDENPTFANYILAPYIAEGYVTVINSCHMFHNTRINRQAEAHNHVLNLSKHNTKWLAMLDMDEFLYPIHKNNLKEVLAEYEDVSALAVSYACFGSSGHTLKPDMQIEAYTKRAKDNWDWNFLTKTIGQTAWLEGCYHHHYFKIRNGLRDENRLFCDWYKPFSGKKIRINHYLTRSAEDYQEKIRRGNPLREPRDWHWFKWADRNEVRDEGIKTKFGGAVRKALEKRKGLWNLSKGKIKMI